MLAPHCCFHTIILPPLSNPQLSHLTSSDHCRGHLPISGSRHLVPWGFQLLEYYRHTNPACLMVLCDFSVLLDDPSNTLASQALVVPTPMTLFSTLPQPPFLSLFVVNATELIPTPSDPVYSTAELYQVFLHHPFASLTQCFTAIHRVLMTNCSGSGWPGPPS